MRAVPAPRRSGAVRLLRTLLRSLLRGGIAYFALFVAVHVVLAAERRFVDAAGLLLLVLVSAPQLVLVLRRRLVLGPVLTGAVCASLAAAAAVGVATLPPGAGGSSYSAWFLGAITFNLLGLAVLGRFLAAWATMGAVAAIAVAWSVLTGQGAALGTELVVRHTATLLVGTALAVGLRRSNAAYAASRVLERERLAQEQGARASAGARRAAAERVLAQAGPALAAIAEGRTLSDGERRDLLVLEGALRDEIRTPLLASGRLRAGVAAARGRGVDVLLMDEAPAADETARAEAADWLVARLDRVAAGAFVGRLRRTDDGLRVSAVVGDDRAETAIP